ncbi:MAG: ICE-like protease [Myxococcaceae bacterium]|nr:ICE-like protease [Myxococcaceae bacterium]
MSSAALLALWLAAAAQAPEEEGQRWALVVGENRGLSSEETLRFAESDASRMLAVLQEVGGVPPARSVSVYGTDANRLRAALKQLSARLAAEATPKDRLIVYVSSHAGEGALHLAGTELPLAELAEFVRAAPVAVALLVVDACRSGALTRLKGLKATDAAPVRVEATDLSGHVFISASGADEYAQESEELQGSTFTHHWVTGLRGAADASHDGRVTLEEAYAWAWSRTLESTFATRGGLQRPAFKVDLRGQGELVLTEVARADGRLTLDSAEPGRWLLVAEQSGAIVADVEKAAGSLVLAVPPGRYRVRLRAVDGYFEREVTVPAQGGVLVRATELSDAPFIRLASKGAAATVLLISAGLSLGSGLVSSVGLELGAAIKLRREGALLGPINLIYGVLGVRDGRSSAAVTFSQTEFELRLGAGHRLQRGSFAASFGLELGAVGVWQRGFRSAAPRFGLEPTALVATEVRWAFAEPFSIYLTADGGAAAVKKDSGVLGVPRFGAGVGVAAAF